jgi:peroxidase
MRFLLSITIVVLIFATLQVHGAKKKKLTTDDVSAALKKARDTLTGAAIRGSRMGETPQHTYVKFSELTKAIGLKSNENLLAYQDLQSQGFSTAQIIAQLSSNRHPICTQMPGPCDQSYPYRNINGTCNNINNPLWGSILQPFRRFTTAIYSDGYNQPRGGRANSNLPNARLVSSTIHSDLILPDPSITNMVPQVGQFLDHDMTLTPESDMHCCDGSNDIDCWSIQVFANDSFYSQVNRPQTCLAFTRSTPYCFPTQSGIREQMNVLTAYVDASQVYGSDAERSHQLRRYSKGQMRVNCDNPNLLPTVKQVAADLGEEIAFMGDFLAGDERVNEMPALATLHTLMIREHNRIANDILTLRPSWTDEQIYQETRRLVIAQWQNIIYGEYLPVILGATSMAKYGLALPANYAQYTTYNANVDATILHSFATAAYRFGHTLINGLIRLVKGLSVVGSYQVRNNFFVSTQITQQTPNGVGYDLILGGLMTQNSQTYDAHITDDLRNFVLRNASSTDNFGSDLIARNLQRGRDHGIQGYGEFRKLCGLKALTTWDARPAEVIPDVWTKLSSLYTYPRDIDLFTGGLAEYPVPGGVSGATFNCLKGLQFSYAKDGDRFFFTHSAQPRPFTPAQLTIIRSRTLGDIICENSVVDATPKNVFRTDAVFEGVANPRISCADTSRTRLDISKFV